MGMWLENIPIALLIRGMGLALPQTALKMRVQVNCLIGCQSLVEPITEKICQHHDQMSCSVP